ncbi:MAG: tRNA (adenosine(37)-N6)-threonylcarbamoyltransferase complex ATPase subunit type 1 TsaE [Bacteroidota bacterium]
MEVTYIQEELSKVAQQLIGTFSEQTIWLFSGEMGAGKTTLIKSICESHKVVDQMSSPTFSIVNEYETDTGETINHFDFYRLKSVEEAIDIGVEDYFYSGDRCFIEWADIIRDLLPGNYLEININLVDRKTRHLITSVHERTL